MLNLWKDEDLFRRYLELQSRIPESAANTVWCAKVRPDSVCLQTYKHWLEMGEHVRAGEKGIKAVAMIYEKPKKWFRVVKNYDYSQLDNPKIMIPKPPQYSIDEFMDVLSLYESNKKGTTTEKQCVSMASAAGKHAMYLTQKDNEHLYHSKDKDGHNVGYMLCYRFLIPDDFQKVRPHFKMNNERFREYNFHYLDNELNGIRKSFRLAEQLFDPLKREPQEGGEDVGG